MMWTKARGAGGELRRLLLLLSSSSFETRASSSSSSSITLMRGLSVSSSSSSSSSPSSASSSSSSDNRKKALSPSSGGKGASSRSHAPRRQRGGLWSFSTDNNSTTTPSSSSSANANKRSFVVTGYGLDRPGIYGQFSRAMLAIRANVESSRLARLGPDFTITALVSFAAKDIVKKSTSSSSSTSNIIRKRTNVKPHTDHHKIRSSVVEVKEEVKEEECETKQRLQEALDTRIDSFTFDVREVPPETRQNEEQSRSRGYKKLIIRATNFPGITARVTETLSNCGLNIETLRMDTKSSPFTVGSADESGDEMYFCETTVRLIEGAFEEGKFDREMAKLEEDLSCDVDVEDVSDMQ